MGRLRFKEITKERIKPKRNIVISEAYNEKNERIGFAVSEQLVDKNDDGTETKVFLKGGLGIISEEGIYNMFLALEKVLIDLGYLESVEVEQEDESENNLVGYQKQMMDKFEKVN